MKKILYFLAALLVCSLSSCQKELECTPFVPFDVYLNNTVFHAVCVDNEVIVKDVELNNLVYHNGDSLYGKIVIDKNEMTPGTNVQKIDCRLGNIVIGTNENQFECPFGVRLSDKPIGVHKLSVIIKCKAPDYDQTYWRLDLGLITITDKENED